MNVTKPSENYVVLIDEIAEQVKGGKPLEDALIPVVQRCVKRAPKRFRGWLYMAIISQGLGLRHGIQLSREDGLAMYERHFDKLNPRAPLTFDESVEIIVSVKEIAEASS